MDDTDVKYVPYHRKFHCTPTLNTEMKVDLGLKEIDQNLRCCFPGRFKDGRRSLFGEGPLSLSHGSHLTPPFTHSPAQSTIPSLPILQKPFYGLSLNDFCDPFYLTALSLPKCHDTYI